MSYVVSGVEHVYPFKLLTGLGYLPRIWGIDKFGTNPNLEADTEANIWDFGGMYAYSTTADIDTISSSSALDTQILTVQGLDADYNYISQNVTLNGQNKVTLTTPMLRVWRVFNTSSINLAGSIYVYVDGAITVGIPDVDNTIRAYISIGNNQTLMMLFTIPLGYTGFILHTMTSLGGKKAGFLTIKKWTRLFGETWRIKRVTDLAAVGTSLHHHNNSILSPIPEKTDIHMTVIGDTLGLTCAASAQMYLVKNE